MNSCRFTTNITSMLCFHGCEGKIIKTPLHCIGWNLRSMVGSRLHAVVAFILNLEDFSPSQYKDILIPSLSYGRSIAITVCY